jgi:murein DD-endopeptidase MepM/ murein hydrolase activator NlpD
VKLASWFFCGAEPAMRLCFVLIAISGFPRTALERSAPAAHAALERSVLAAQFEEVKNENPVSERRAPRIKNESPIKNENHAPQIASPQIASPQVASPQIALPQIVLPLKEIRAADLRDSFNELHNGHRHQAIDLMAPRGTPVLAVTEGRIEKLFLSKADGKTIYQFDDSKIYCYYYAHLDRYAVGLSECMHVSRGTIIGYVGSTGDASPNAPHLHFGIYRLGSKPLWWKGVPMNPYPVLLTSVTGAHRAAE